MSTITNRKITDGQRNAVWVQHQQDRLTGTPQENKSVFDEYAELIREHFNGAMDDIDDALGDVSTDFGQIESRVEALEEINVEEAAISARAYAESAQDYASMVSDQLAEATSYASKHFKMTRSSGEGVPFAEFIFNPYDYAYSDKDYYEVFVNGFKLNENEYSVSKNPSTNMSIVRLSDPIEETGNVIEVCVTKFLDPATYVAQAQEYAEDAEASREDAEGWARSAYGYAEQAEASATSIGNVEERIREVSAETHGYRDDAEGFKDDAETAAGNASTYAGNASASAMQAQTYAGNASTSAGNAQTYAGNASTSATQASGYATNASTSATSAEDSAEDSEAWAVGQRGGVDVPSTDPTYENNSKYWAEQSLANQYGAYIVKSASGEIASFSDGADDVPMKSVKVAIVPKQSGSGDPSPSNVRPISGTSTANVMVTGKNLIGIKNCLDQWGATYTQSGDKYTVTNLGNGYGTHIRFAEQPVQVTLSGNITDNGASSLYIDLLNEAGTQVGRLTSTTPSATATACKIRLNKPSGTLSSVLENIQIELGTTATAYVPYNGHTAPVPLGQTVYGGEVNPISGELVIDRAMISSANCTYSVYASSTARMTIIIPNGAPNVKSTYAPGDMPNIICDKLKTQSKNGLLTSDYTISQSDAGNSRFMICHIKSDVNSVEAMQTWAGNNPFTIVYEIATPTTVQLTPTQIATLLGTNNVWSDAGAVEVEYRADPTLAYNELANVIVSLGGNL